MPSQASSQGSEKNKNLLAAKASLGLSTEGSISSSYQKNPVKRNSINSVSSSLSGSTTTNESSRKIPASSSSLRSGHRSNSSSTASEGKKSIHSNSNSKSVSIHEASRLTSESGSELNSTFDNSYEDKIDYFEDKGAASLQSIKEEVYTALHDSNTNISERSELYDSNNNLSQRSELYMSDKSDLYYSNANKSQSQGSGLHDSNTNFSQGSELYNSNTNASERSDLYDSNTNITEKSDLYDSNTNLSQSQESELYDSNTNFSQESELHDSYNYSQERSADDTSQRSREDFIPKRFDEMRKLLSAITPLQLEALIQEIFGNDGPPGWIFKGKRSKRGFRKDAYLSEMSLEELQNFARRMDNLGLDYCGSNEEALDLIAIEFERLVTLHQNKDDQSTHVSGLRHQNSNNSTVSFEEDQMTLGSEASEGNNLRQSLRACSFPELRLVAERLRLDPSVCVTKEELVHMIENSMPDLVEYISQGSQSHQGSQSQALIEEDYNNYYQPTRQQHQSQRQRRSSGERRRKVKFSDGEGRRKVKFANDTKEGKSQPLSTRKGNLGDGQDLESAPLVQTNGGKGSSRLSVMRNHVWKIAASMLLLVLIIGLSAGLSGRKSKVGNDANSGRPYVLLPENDPFFSDFYASSRTSTPSSSPSQSKTDNDSEAMSLNQGQPSSTSGGVFLMNRLKPTTEPTAFPSTETYSPTETDTIQPTYMPTRMPVGTSQIETEKPSTVPKFSITTAQPTPLSPYPLLGPYEESDMKMVVYGISELSQMGKTQFKMLTAAYVEQFYNDEGRGTDAFQNIVFDVAASIDITNVESPPTRRERRARRLQSGILIITFTMNLSYRSFSNGVDAKTVSERPFLEESMHADFVQFLRDNNAARFVGDVSDITSIFRGDEIPEIIYPQVQEENSPAKEDTAAATSPEAAPASNPTPLTTSPPSSSPTYVPTPSPTRRPANQMNKPKPTPGKVIHTYSPVRK